MRGDDRKAGRTSGQMERRRGEKLEGDRWSKKEKEGEHGDVQGGLNFSLSVLCRERNWRNKEGTFFLIKAVVQTFWETHFQRVK